MQAANNLAEQFPPLTKHEALVEANRCLYCYDAPCAQACPTHINIPGFIKKISTENLKGSARTILESNLIGATCARVCPVQELCEGACVLNAEHKPIMIGRLQRYAMDYLYDNGVSVFPAVPPTGRRIAVIGAGPAGLSCAGELARRGHSVSVFEKRALAGGLSTHGIITLREPVQIALAEVEMIAGLGVKVVEGAELGVNLPVATLLSDFDAVFVATGLGGSPLLGIPGEQHILDGLRYIETSKLTPDELPTGRSVIVIGAGNTAIDCATIARRTGAERVTIVYRRTEPDMPAYPHEYEFVRKEGVGFEFLTLPVAVHASDGKVTGLECLRAPDPSTTFTLAADCIIKAIGQKKTSVAELLGLETERGYIRVDADLRTNIENVYAGGDCVRAKGAASTVMAVQDGKIAAAAIIRQLSAQAQVTHG
jgi:glutamate synthase (NADPH/NADH) small chain